MACVAPQSAQVIVTLNHGGLCKREARQARHPDAERSEAEGSPVTYSLKRSFAGFAAQDERISQTGLEGCRPTARPGSASGSFPPSIEQAIDGGRWLSSSRPADALAPAPGSYPRPAHRELAESQCAAGDLPLRPA